MHPDNDRSWSLILAAGAGAILAAVPLAALSAWLGLLG